MGRVGVHARRELAVPAALAAAFLACAAGLWAVHSHTRPRYRLSAAAAVAAARANPADRAFLAKNPATTARVIPLDSELQRVTFFAGDQVVLDAAVGPRGEVRDSEEHVAGASASGAAVANAPWLLALLSGLFLLATMVTPVRRVRNLDAMVLAGMTATVPLINARLVGASVVWASLGLLYLTVRCLYVGVAARHAPRPPSTAVLTRLLCACAPRRRLPLARALVLGVALAFAAVTLTSAGFTDVAAASLQGATELLHGVSPYGHITVALHGDTYPLLNYVLYIPGALWEPVSNPFSELSGSLVVTLAASLLAGAAVYRLAGSAGAPDGAADPAARDAEPRAERQLRLTLAWFSFPPVLLAASGGANDVVVAACLAWMLALRRRPGASVAALGMGVWVKLVPLALAAVWLPTRRRDWPRALAGGVALSVALAALSIALGGGGALPAMVRAMAFQFQRGSFFAPWYTFDLQWLQPVVQAGALTLLLAAAIRVRADRSLGGDVVRMSALGAALLLGIQVSANYWTWSYLPWVLPLLLAGLFMTDGGRPAAVAGTARRASAGPASARRQERAGLAGRRPRDRSRSPSAAV